MILRGRMNCVGVSIVIRLHPCPYTYQFVQYLSSSVLSARLLFQSQSLDFGTHGKDYQKCTLVSVGCPNLCTYSATVHFYCISSCRRVNCVGL